MTADDGGKLVRDLLRNVDMAVRFHIADAVAAAHIENLHGKTVFLFHISAEPEHDFRSSFKYILGKGGGNTGVTAAAARPIRI